MMKKNEGGPPKGMKGTEVSFDDDGNPKLEGIGFTKSDGALCEKVSDELVEAMGGKITDRTYKPEYNRAGASARATVSN